MKAHAENILHALRLGIETRSRFEKGKLNYTSDSAFVAGIKELCGALERGERIEIIYPTGKKFLIARTFSDNG